MANRSKIVGITHVPSDTPPQSANLDSSAPVLNDHLDDSFAEKHSVNMDSQTESSPEYYPEYEEGNRNSSSWIQYAAPIFLTALMLGWTAFFGWLHQIEFLAMRPTNVVRLISEWAMPAVLIGVIWLLILRSSRSETNKFSDAAVKLRNESEALEAKMRAINGEITVAREFLAQNSRELESIGRQSATRLIEAAEKIGVALNDSETKAKILEQVSNAATANLDQLRKHLPVVTSAAKDVTNQIGSAGNNAQSQVKSLIAGLQSVSEAGAEARSSIAGMAERAAQASDGLSQRITENAALLRSTIEQSAQQVQQLTTTVNSSALTLSATLEQGTSDTVVTMDHAITNLAAKIELTSSEIDQMVERNLAALNQRAAMLHQSVSDMESKVKAEDARSEKMIARIDEHLGQHNLQLQTIDEQATQRLAKLTSALEALISTSGQLIDDFDLNNLNADELAKRSEQILQTVNGATHVLEEALPAALSNANDHIAHSLIQLDHARQQASGLGEYSDNLLSKLIDIEQVITARRDDLESLTASGDASLADSQRQTNILAESLIRTQALISELSQIKDEGLIETLGRIQENIRIEIQQSRKMMETEMDSVAARLSEASQNSLKSAVEAQVSNVDRIISETIQTNISLSNSATEQLHKQLDHINSMTSNLERRLADARSEFTGFDDDSFARQMVFLTESLNSTAIDVTKILSNEVTDTSWAAYLKGDRGIFTRRAVRLLSFREARTIAGHYNDDAEFRAHVNRYVHDFESMMRTLLSTRDGNAIGVTLLSSDVGKLYVALAQAIERLRNN